MYDKGKDVTFIGTDGQRDNTISMRSLGQATHGVAFQDGMTIGCRRVGPSKLIWFAQDAHSDDGVTYAVVGGALEPLFAAHPDTMTTHFLIFSQLEARDQCGTIFSSQTSGTVQKRAVYDHVRRNRITNRTDRSPGVINDCAFELRRCDAASVSKLDILQAELSVTLPDDLFNLLLESNGDRLIFNGRFPIDVSKISSVAEIIQGTTWLANSFARPSTPAPVPNVGRATDTERTIALVSSLSDPTFATGAILRNVDESDTLSFCDALFLADSVGRFVVHSLEFMQTGSGHARYWDADGYALANVGK